nr:hypothetical protein Iba_chr11cCG11580 [Ipomoea batatas]
MENSRYKKGNQNCNPLHEAISQAWEIKMTNHPLITYHIPHSPVLINCFCIPPIFVKLTITKSQKFCKNI